MNEENDAWGKFTELSVGKQVGIIGSITFGIVFIIGLMMWGMSPTYRVLYNDLAGTDVSAIMDQLTKDGVDYRLNENTGAILVARDQVYKIRLQMAAKGIPETNNSLDFFDSGQRMGLSKKMEEARLKKVMEIELSKSIDQIKGVSGTRIHIALPENSVFSRERGKVSASIVINTTSKLSEYQIKSIISLVSKSVARLSPENVSIVDTNGNLLSKGGEAEIAAEYTNKLENTLEKRIAEIIGSVVGEANVNAKASIEMDFARSERTSEIFSPKSGQIRSEQWEESVVNDENKSSGDVPGALSNQPLQTDVSTEGEKKKSEPVLKKDGSFTKNYELDKTITHVKNKEPGIKRITVAVVINLIKEIDGNGNVEYKPRSEDEMKEFKKIVENTVGFDSERGDNVVVISKKFESLDMGRFETATESSTQWYEESIVLEGGKWGTVLISILLIVFLVIRPLIRNIFAKEIPEEGEAEEEEDKTLSPAGEIKEGEARFEEEMAEVRKIADDDPAIVAQVVKQWISEDEGKDDE